MVTYTSLLQQVILLRQITRVFRFLFYLWFSCFFLWMSKVNSHVLFHTGGRRAGPCTHTRTPALLRRIHTCRYVHTGSGHTLRCLMKDKTLRSRNAERCMISLLLSFINWPLAPDFKFEHNKLMAILTHFSDFVIQPYMQGKMEMLYPFDIANSPLHGGFRGA